MGVPLPVVGDTVAVKVTLALTATGLGDTVRAVVLAVVPAVVIVRDTAGEMLAA